VKAELNKPTANLLGVSSLNMFLNMLLNQGIEAIIDMYISIINRYNQRVESFLIALSQILNNDT
jgi:hypothetical protein